MFTDTDEPLTFVAHGDHEVMRVWKMQSLKNDDKWMVEIFYPAGVASFVLDHARALEMAAMFQAVTPKTANT